MNPAEEALKAAILAELLELLDAKNLAGPFRTFCFYRPLKGENLAKQILNSNDKGALASYGASFKKQCDNLGARLPRDKYHDWKDYKNCERLFDYKHRSSKTRIVGMTDQWGLTILLHGFSKTEDEAKSYEVTEAQRLRDEYLSRRAAIAARKIGGKGGNR